ncbi:hypothetical protein [Bacillus sp. ISL-46]|uniref:hypothetical protein n=1 Tax=Bacillus sp. ISL-46 TaxID=2819129 RepID=UPI0020355111|nr:hypothetical protein [Bacillus sp. ISL-46]
MSFEDRRILVRVAQMYYEEGATQSRIADEISVSRSLISKYLAKAKELGIVEVIIHDETIHPYRRLEGKIERLYGLREVLCIPNLGNETSRIVWGRRQVNISYESFGMAKRLEFPLGQPCMR